MPVLNQANAIYSGSHPASAVYSGTTKVWPAVIKHRYWRLNLLSGTNPNYTSLAEVQFRTTPGQSLLFSGGTPSASSVYGAGYEANKASDNDPSTLWASASQSWPMFWQYDYGAGTTLNIVEVTITARNDGSYATTPQQFQLQWSDDGSNWTTVQSWTTAWTGWGECQVFPVDPTLKPHRYWRIHILSTVQATYGSLAETQFRTTPGVPLLFSGGTPSASSIYGAGYEADKACDNNPATLWNSGTQAFPLFWQYDYGAGNALLIREVSITARSDTGYTTTPSDFQLRWSDDGVAWGIYKEWTATWTASQTQLFN